MLPLSQFVGGLQTQHFTVRSSLLRSSLAWEVCFFALPRSSAIGLQLMHLVYNVCEKKGEKVSSELVIEILMSTFEESWRDLELGMAI